MPPLLLAPAGTLGLPGGAELQPATNDAKKPSERQNRPTRRARNDECSMYLYCAPSASYLSPFTPRGAVDSVVRGPSAGAGGSGLGQRATGYGLRATGYGRCIGRTRL